MAYTRDQFTKLSDREQLTAIIQTMEVVVMEVGGDHLVTDCRYYDDDGNPDCIVGRIMHKFGYRRDDMGEGLNVLGSWAEINTCLISAVSMYPGLKDDARALLAFAQATQDRGIRWGEVYRKAYAEYINLTTK